jgi:dienelactone hydrolase
MSALIAQYDKPWTFAAGKIAHPIYSAGKGKPVVILHELPGMIEECLDLGLILSQNFRVHLPLLFGKPGRASVLGAVAQICISREINLFAANRPGPILDWLRALCRKLKTDAGVDGIGVIGMCLTGGFALALVADDSVLAPVVAQPSLPVFVHKAALGLSEADTRAVKVRAAALGANCVLGLRYASDRISPREKVDSIKALIGPAFDYQELPGDEHSTLTAHRHPQALARTIAFLQARL